MAAALIPSGWRSWRLQNRRSAPGGSGKPSAISGTGSNFAAVSFVGASFGDSGAPAGRSVATPTRTAAATATPPADLMGNAQVVTSIAGGRSRTAASTVRAMTRAGAGDPVRETTPRTAGRP